MHRAQRTNSHSLHRETCSERMAQSRAMNRGSSASEPHPTKHSDVPKPSQAAGCSRSHVAASSLPATEQSSIEALATIE